MSDISASEGSEAVSEAPVADAAVETPVAEVEAFDLDTAVDDLATNAPDEWKGKVGKIQSELKNLRGKYTPYRDAFEGVHDDDREAVLTLVNAIKSGDTDAAAEWMFNAAKGLTGAEFEAKFGLTKAEAAEAVEAMEGGEEAPEQELSIQEQIQKALDERDAAHKEQLAMAERQAVITNTFSELGYSTERNAQGHLTDPAAQIVAQLAVNNHKGDIKAAHEAFTKLKGDWAKDMLQAKTSEQSTSPGQGAPIASGEPLAGEENMTADQKAEARVRARFERLARGAQT